MKDRLKLARKRAGMTQKEVAARAGITESTYCGYETGKRQPDALRIKQLARILDVTGDYLLGLEDIDVIPPADDLTADELELLELYRQLNAEGRRAAMTYTEFLLTQYSQKNNPVPAEAEAG